MHWSWLADTVQPMNSTKTEEAAIRGYLMFLQDPAQLVDQTLIVKLEQRLSAATDPLDRLIALAEHERALHPDEAPYRAAFIAHARQWAETNNVPATAFEKLGVAVDVLSEAGLAPRQRVHKRTRRAASESAPSVTTREIKDAISRMQGEFTIGDIAQAAGGSPMTVRKALNEMVEQGQVRRIGPAENWSSKGRAPIMYELTSPS